MGDNFEKRRNVYNRNIYIYIWDDVCYVLLGNRVSPSFTPSVGIGRYPRPPLVLCSEFLDRLIVLQISGILRECRDPPGECLVEDNQSVDLSCPPGGY